MGQTLEQLVFSKHVLNSRCSLQSRRTVMLSPANCSAFSDLCAFVMHALS